MEFVSILKEKGVSDDSIMSLMYILSDPVMTNYVQLFGLEKLRVESENGNLHGFLSEQLSNADSLSQARGDFVSDDGIGAESLTSGLRYQIDSLRNYIDKVSTVPPSKGIWEVGLQVESVDAAAKLLMHYKFPYDMMDGKGAVFIAERCQTFADEVSASVLGGEPLEHDSLTSSKKDPGFLKGFGAPPPTPVCVEELVYTRTEWAGIPVKASELLPTQIPIIEKAPHVMALSRRGVERYCEAKGGCVAEDNGIETTIFGDWIGVGINSQSSVLPARLREVYSLLKSGPGRAFYLHRLIRSKFFSTILEEKKHVVKAAFKAAAPIKAVSNEVTVTANDASLMSTDTALMIARSIIVNRVVIVADIKAKYNIPACAVDSYQKYKARFSKSKSVSKCTLEAVGTDPRPLATAFNDVYKMVQGSVPVGEENAIVLLCLSGSISNLHFEDENLHWRK